MDSYILNQFSLDDIRLSDDEYNSLVEKDIIPRNLADRRLLHEVAKRQKNSASIVKSIAQDIAECGENLFLSKYIANVGDKTNAAECYFIYDEYIVICLLEFKVVAANYSKEGPYLCQEIGEKPIAVPIKKMKSIIVKEDDVASEGKVEVIVILDFGKQRIVRIPTFSFSVMSGEKSKLMTYGLTGDVNSIITKGDYAVGLGDCNSTLMIDKTIETLKNIIATANSLADSSDDTNGDVIAASGVNQSLSTMTYGNDGLTNQEKPLMQKDKSDITGGIPDRLIKQAEEMLQSSSSIGEGVYCPHCGAAMIAVEKHRYDTASKIWNKLANAPDPLPGRYGKSIVIEECPRRTKVIAGKTYPDIDFMKVDEALLKKRYQLDELRRREHYLGLPATVDLNFDLDNYCVKAQLTTYENTSNTILAYKGMKGSCPRCGQVVVFSDFAEYTNSKAAEKAINELKNQKHEIAHNNHPNNDTVDIQEYLKTLVDVSQNILLLEGELRNLYGERESSSLTSSHKAAAELLWKEMEASHLFGEIKTVESQLERKKADLSCLDEIAITAEDIRTIAKEEGIELPIEPSVPQMPDLIKIYPSDLEEPKEPEMKVAGFFNRKKVEEENAIAKAAYDEQRKKYEKALNDKSQNEKNTEKYNEEYNRYEEQKKQYDIDFRDACNMIVPLAEKRKRAFVEEQKAKLNSEIERLEIDKRVAEEKIAEKDGFEKYESYVWNTGLSYASLKYKSEFFESEIDETKEHLKKQYEVLQTLLEAEIVFPKYNNVVAWSTMYEYFVTGRVTELGGPNGAYNLYESELRANIIISKLDVIIDKLDAIKDNQYVLYTALMEVNSTLNDISRSLKSTNFNLDRITESQRAIEYNTKKTAMYSDIIARTNTAIAFMKAIWG